MDFGVHVPECGKVAAGDHHHAVRPARVRVKELRHVIHATLKNDPHGTIVIGADLFERVHW